MSCESYKLNGFGRECRGNVGGIKKIWMISADGASIDAAKLKAATEAGDKKIKASDIVLADEDTPFVEYVFAKETGSITSTLTNDANGKRYTNTVALQFNRMEGKKHLEIEAIAAGDALILLQDRNNVIWYVGADNAASLSEATATSGEGYDSLNGYNTTLEAVSAYLPFEVVTDGAEATAWGKLVSESADFE